MFANVPKKGIITAALVILIAYGISYFIISYRKTMPMNAEGFSEGFRAMVGGDLACGHALSDASNLLGLFTGKEGMVGNAHYEELRTLLGKMACFKSDLMSTSGLVNATRHIPYVTSHDREQVSETTARCFAKTIPDRDLDIIFETWYSRGKTLVTKLATKANLSEIDTVRAENLLKTSWEDVYNVARGACIAGTPQIAGKAASPRDVVAFMPEELADHGDYKGYY
jgi:hypothetical protein